MSTICVTNHNEHICHLVEQPSSIVGPCASPGCPSYISKYRPKVLREERKVKECHRTFGFAAVPLPKPCEFLRKNSRIVPQKSVPGNKCRYTCRKPGLPPCAVVKCPPKPDPTKVWDECWKKGKGKRYCIDRADCQTEQTEQDSQRKCKVYHCGKNFIFENIHRVVHSIPKQPKPKFVDTRKGDTQVLIKSGLLPTYIHKKNYGRVPGFVSCMRGTVCGAQPVCEKPCAQAISEAERVKLLEGLRHNWAELQKAYQLLPVLTDTLHRRLRKQCIEKELRQLEHDIRTIERHAHIYVVDECVS